MSSRSSEDIKAGLSRKGFVKKNGDHVFLWFHYEGKKTSIRTKVSHGDAECGDSLLLLMARQLGLTKAEFLDLVDCPMSQDEFVRKATAARRLRP